jgi:hypothetical protein
MSKTVVLTKGMDWKCACKGCEFELTTDKERIEAITVEEYLQRPLGTRQTAKSTADNNPGLPPEGEKK